MKTAEIENVSDGKDSLTEVVANLSLSDFKRRERLIEIVRGTHPQWRYAVPLAVASLAFVPVWLVSKHGIDVGSVTLVLCVAIGILLNMVRAEFDKRLNALVELIGDESLMQFKKMPEHGPIEQERQSSVEPKEEAGGK